MTTPTDASSPEPEKPSRGLVLVTGATGYVGARLIPYLLAAGYRVRALVRNLSRVEMFPWAGQVEAVHGDVLRPESLPPAMAGVKAAYYLIHSLEAGPDFQQRDLLAARNFGAAAKAAGVERIVYLGGLGDPETRLSRHLRSRQRTGEALRESGVPVTEFRAAVIVGAGSVSFEMIRYLTDRLPVMICPLWVYTRVQPIAIKDVVSYLVRALEVPESAEQIIEIGGAEVLTYQDMMLRYARARHQIRFMIPVPMLTPSLSSYWVSLITPVPFSIARPLIQGLRNEVVVRSDLARRIFPDIRPVDYAAALKSALKRPKRVYV